MEHRNYNRVKERSDVPSLSLDTHVRNVLGPPSFSLPDTAASTIVQASFLFSFLSRFIPNQKKLCELLHLLGNDCGLLLLRYHNLESVKIGKVGSLLLGGKLLGPAGLLPLGLDLGLRPCLLEGLGAGVAGDLDGKVGEGDALVGDDLTGDAGNVLGTIDEALVLIDNVDDGSELSGLWSVVDEDDPPNLDVT